MVSGGLLSATKAENIKYLRSRRQFPLRTQPTIPNTIESKYTNLKQCIEKEASEVECKAKAPWISESTWKLIDSRASKSKCNSFRMGERQRLSRRIKRALNRDRKQRTTDAGEEIEQHLREGRLKTAWNKLQHWYRHSGNRPPKPTRLDLKKVTLEYKELYKDTTPPGDPINIEITPHAINDDIPTDDEIATAVRKLRNGKAPGHSGVRAEHLKALLHRAKKENATDEDRMGWDQTCTLIQKIFENGDIPEEMTWTILVLIPKSSGGTRGIGLLEIFWKVCSSIINNRLQQSVEFHEALHGFREYRGTGTASLDAKLQMQLAQIRGIPLYQIFLDLSKAYDMLDRNRTLQLLQRYGMGERLLKILTNFWSSLRVVARQQGYYGDPFKSKRGTTQGDIISPTIFNIIVDAIVRAWYHQLESENLSDKVRAVFFADDGHIYSNDAEALQRALEIIVQLFERMGLQTNPTKTKAMVCAPNPTVTRICTPAYKRRMEEINNNSTTEPLPTYSERKRQQIECEICHARLQARSIA
jgi:hypothetical protein